MIVGMYRLFRANHPTHHFNRAVGNHLIGVHVGLRARASLPHHQRKVIIKQTARDFACRLLDGFAFVIRQLTKGRIGHRTALFDYPKCADDSDGLLFPTDRKVDQRSLSLCTPIFVRGNV